MRVARRYPLHPCNAGNLNRSSRPGRAPVAELAVIVTPPGPEFPVHIESNGMPRPCRNGHHTIQTIHLHESLAAHPPCPDRPVTLEGNRMGVACRNSRHPRERGNERRNNPLCAPRHELLMIEQAPGIDGPIGRQRQRPGAAGCHSSYTGKPGDLDGGSALRRGAVSELTVRVSSPGPYGAVILQRHSMGRPGSDCTDPRDTLHPEWTYFRVGCAVAELAGRIVPERPDGPIQLEDNGMVFPSSHDGPTDRRLLRSREAPERPFGHAVLAVARSNFPVVGGIEVKGTRREYGVKTACDERWFWGSPEIDVVHQGIYAVGIGAGPAEGRCT